MTSSSAHGRPAADRRRIVWLASYPKSGNTWTRLLLANLLSASDEAVSINETRAVLPGGISSDRRFLDEWIGVPLSDSTDDEMDVMRPALYRALAAQAARSDVRLFYKAHDAYLDTPAGTPLFPDDATVGAVYLLRNPLDVAVSLAFHVGSEDFAESVARVNDPEARMGGCRTPQLRQRLLDWSGHVESWTGAPFPVLTVRYEDLMADAVGQLARIAKFLRLDRGADERRLRHAVACADFARLQENEEREGFKERDMRTRRFFRSGKVGDWRRYLTAAQARDVVRRHGRVMVAHGYDLQETREQPPAGLPDRPPGRKDGV